MPTQNPQIMAPIEAYADVSLVENVFKKMYSLLPMESNKTSIEVEESQLFLGLRKSLLTVCSSELMDTVMDNFAKILDAINQKDGYLVLKQRNSASLSSLLIMLRLLADLAKTNWDSKDTSLRKNSVESTHSNQSFAGISSIGLGSAAIDYHSIPPDPLDSSISIRAMSLISRLKSTNTLAQELALINGKPVPPAPMYEDLTVRPLLDQIDLNCEAILRFIGAANRRDFFEFTVSKLSVLKHNIGNDSEFSPYLELFSSVYLDEQWFYQYLKHLRVIMATVKKAAYRQLVLSFFTKSLKIWIYSRPQEFLNSSKEESKASIEAEILFDEMLSLPDSALSKVSPTQSGGKQIRTHFKFIGTLLALNPRALSLYLSGVGGSKSTLKKLTSFGSNKKQKLLSSVMKTLDQSPPKDNSENISVLESLDFMVAIALVASSVYSHHPDNVSVRFTLENYDLVSKALVPVNVAKMSPLLFNPGPMEITLLNGMRMTYFTSMCIINSKDFIPMFVVILNDPTSPLDILTLTCSILKQFSLTPAWLNAHQNQLLSMLPALRKIMLRMGNLVKSNSYSASVIDEEDTVSLGKSSSASSNEFHQYRTMIAPEAKAAMVMDSLRTSSTPSSVASTTTPKSEKFKESAKNLLKHHHSSNHVVANHNSTDDSRSFIEKDAKPSLLSRQVLTNAFEIFRKNPHAYFYGTTSQASEESFRDILLSGNTILEPLVVALRDSNGRLAVAAKQFIQSFISISNIADTPEALISCYTGSALIGSVLAKSILNYTSSETTRKDIMEYFVRILEYRTNLYDILAHHSYLNDVVMFERPYYTQMMSPIDQALLLVLCTPNVETYPLTKRGFKAFYQELDKSKSPDVIRSNFGFYSAVVNDSTFTTGTVALQKIIRKFFLQLCDPTPSVVEAWLRIYSKWYQFAKSDYSELTQTELSNFRNFAGFLAAISGLFVGEDIPTQPWYTKEIHEEIQGKIEQFILQQFSMLGEESMVTRENAREILTSECNPKTYPKVITILVPIVDNLAGNAGHLTERDLTIIDHIIALLKAVFSKGNDTIVFSSSIDILKCVDKLATIVDGKHISGTSLLKLRIRMSMMFVEMEKCRNSLLIASAYKLRNKFLRYVYNWFDHAMSNMSDLKREPMIPHAFFKDLDYMYIDVAMESSKSLSLLLEDLVLEAQQVLNVRELQYSKSSLFNIYFNTFLKSLEKYSAVDDFPVSMRHKVNTISENIVTCLTNLLKSNVDVGLQYALPIGYHTNLPIRVSFLRVFVSIVESYFKLESESNPQEKRLMVANIFKLILEDPKFISALANAAPSFEAPAFASCALSLASSMNQSANLIAYLVEHEIMAASSYSDILRRNSFASRSLSAFGRTVGLDNLVTTLRPILTEIRDSEADFEVEKLDPEDPQADENLNNFLHYLTKLVNAIINSFDNIPLEFKYVCKKISEAVDKKFTNSRLIAVGSFIFLRYFCPVIVSPETEKIVTVPNRQTQRKYLLLTKVLQNFANGTMNSMRWPLLKKRERELNNLYLKVTEFLDRLTKVDDSVTFEFQMSTDIKENDYNFFHTFLYENWIPIREQFLEAVTNESELKSFMSIAQRTDGFLKAAGQPTLLFGYELPPSITAEATPELYDFMNKYSTRELGGLLDCSFIYQGFSQSGVQLLVFSYAEYKKIKNYDEELIMYRIIQVASKIWNNKFVFVMDCTGNDGSVVYPTRMMRIFGEFAPSVMHENCTGLVYYNVSSGLYPKLIDALKSNQGFQHVPSMKFNFVSGTSDRKSIMNLGLSNQAIHAYSDVRVKFADVSLFEPDQGRFIPVLLRIGNEFMQLSQTTPQRVMLRGELKEIFLNDVYHLEEIDNVSITEQTSVPNEITITMKTGKKLILTSPKFLEIMRLLYFTKSRALSTSNQDSSKQDVQKTAEDLLGQLFNVIFIGLTSASDEVRSITYNLLAATQHQFGIDFGREIVRLPEVYFPKENNPFVVDLSERLAISMPEITTEFISAFFDAYTDSATPRQRLSSILFVSPWVSNISKHIYKFDAERGRDVARKIISNFLNIATKDPLFLSGFNLSIFSNLCLEDDTSLILVDEVVANAIDREAEGGDWRTGISFLTCFPTVAMCGYVIKKLTDITSIEFPNAKGKYTLEAHAQWTETTVLVHICVSFFFDSLTFTEMFLPDIFHIVSILIDVGPFDLRIGCHQLLLNVLQNFLSKKSLSETSKSVVQRNVEHFTSHRSRLLFGLNRESPDSFPTEVSKFNSRISTLESLVASLMEIIEVTGDIDEKAVWISRWNRYVVNTVCRDDPVLKGRSLILIGILAKNGLDDLVARCLLEYIGDGCSNGLSDPKSVYLAICTIFSLTRMTDGLLQDSNMFGRMFWLAVFISHSDLSPLFQSGLKFVTRTLSCMSIKEKFVNGETVSFVMKDRPIFGEMLDTAERIDGYSMTTDNFDQVLLYFTAKGLQLPYAKASAIDSLLSLFMFRFMNEAVRAEVQGHMDTSPLSYLLFLAILLKPKDLLQTLNDSDLADEFYVLNEQLHLPKILADFLLSDSDASNLALIQASNYFSEGAPNEKTCLRFICVLKFIGQRNPYLLMKVYHIIKPCLRAMIASNTIASDLLTETLDVAAIAIVMPEYKDDERMKAQTMQLLTKYKLTGVLIYKFVNPEQPEEPNTARAQEGKGMSLIKSMLQLICRGPWVSEGLKLS